RRMGFQRPQDYPHAVAVALEKYRDEDVAKGENILDSWSLVNVAFRRSPVLKVSRATISIVEGRSMGELTAAPRFESLWKQPQSADVLFGLVTRAESRLVRVWAIQLLKRLHSEALKGVSPDQLLRLLDHPDEEVQQFGAGLLSGLDVDRWSIATWFQL